MANCSCLQRKVDVSEKTRCYQNIRILQEFVGIKQMKAEFFKTSDKKSSRLCLMFENLERWTKGVEKYENIKPRLFIYRSVPPRS